MTGSDQYSVATAAQLLGETQPVTSGEDGSPTLLPPTNGKNDYKEAPDHQMKSVRFTPSTKGASGKSSVNPDPQLFRFSTMSDDFSFEPRSDTQVDAVAPLTTGQTLQAVSYRPRKSPFSHDFITDDVFAPSSSSTAQSCPTESITRTLSRLSIDTSANDRGLKALTRRSKKDPLQFEIFFSPNDFSKSKVSLSSPKLKPFTPPVRVFAEEDEDVPTPKAARPRTQIFHGRRRKSAVEPVQLDELVAAFTKAPLIQKHVKQHWWDGSTEEVSETETNASFGTVSTPTLTTASSLYSHPNQPFVGAPSTQRPSGKTRFGGIALADPKVHGTPLRFISKDYRSGENILEVGQCTFLNAPYGTEVECSLRVQSPTAEGTSPTVMLQAISTVVDRRSGQREYLLVSELDVTAGVIKAALAEVGAADVSGNIQTAALTAVADMSGKHLSTVDAADSRPITWGSEHVDWCAIADELSQESDLADAVEVTTAAFPALTAETCTMQTLSFMSDVATFADKHQDFLILRPTGFHANGVPSSIRIPYLTKRLYYDWYEKDGGEMGTSVSAEEFKERLVGQVAMHAAAGVQFDTKVAWGKEELYLQCVPLTDAVEGRANAWVCFVKGEFDV